MNFINEHKQFFAMVGYGILFVIAFWAILSAILIMFEVIPFSWWHLPCWILTLMTVGVAIGLGNQSAKDYD